MRASTFLAPARAVIAVACLWSVTVPSPAAGQVPAIPKVIDLGTALRLAMLQNPDLSTARSRIQAAEGRASDAGRRPNPTLDATAENWGGGLGSNQTEFTVALTQVLELGGDRSARSDAAEMEAQLASIDFSVTERELLGLVTQDFLDAWWAQGRLARIREAERFAAEALVAASGRVKAGAASPVERIRAEGTLALRQLELRRAGSEFDIARRALALGWGATGAAFDSLDLAPPDTAPPPTAEELLPRLTANPGRLRADAEVAAAEARAREARASKVPDVEVGFGARRMNDVDATGFVGGVSVPLPLWGPGRGAVSAADADRSVFSSRARETTLRLESRLYSLRDRLVASIDAYVGSRDRVLPLSDEALRELGAGYRSGRFGYVELLDGQRASLEARMAVLDAARDVWSARLALARLTGEPLTPGSGQEGR